MIECNFVKPGKGQALYKCKLRNLLRGTVLDRTYKSGDSLEAADIEEIQAQFLYRQQRPVRLHGQRDLRAVRTDRRTGRRRLEVSQGRHGLQHRAVQQPARSASRRRTTSCSRSNTASRPCKGNTATNVTKPCKVETGAEFPCPSFVNIGDLIKIDTRTGEYMERVKA